MSGQDPQPPYPHQAMPSGWPTPPPPRSRKSHRRRNWLIAIAVLTVAGAIAGGVSSGGKRKTAVTALPTESATATPAAVSATASSTAEAPAPAVPNPDGTVTGSCAYELAADYSDTHAGDLNGEVDLENTGNVGIVLNVTITWPQLGHAPIKLGRQKVGVAYGQTVTVPFTRLATGSEIDRLQSWQAGHDNDDGCTYNGTIVDTFGAAH